MGYVQWVDRLLVMAVIPLATVAIQADDRWLAAGQWRYYSGDNGSRKYSPLDQIRRDNVSTLRMAWRRPQVDPSLTAGAADLRLSGPASSVGPFT